ncbi:DNA-directed RNA polymerase subunit beta' [Aureispira]|nr:DNA-directed RNA polymerase subunit beta' [Aureispira sp.]
MPFKKNYNAKPKPQFNSIILSLASPDAILERSYGEVLKPETINYRSYKPERDGLFCERIFGPVKDYECYCGKYKRIRYKGIVCDRCGVEVTEKKVRRERMGHIKLVVPVVHIWYFKSLPNKIGYLLGYSSKKLETIIYYERYVVIQPGVVADKGINGSEVRDLITEEEYLDILDSLPKENHLLPDDDPNKFVAKMGADAVKELLSRMDLKKISYELRHKAATENSQQRKSEALKRLRVVEAFKDGHTRMENKPEWMVIEYLPVIPPELRPLVPLDGGRFASSDMNDLYRRVIIRNNRLKRLLEIKAPEVILRNEKRMLQEAVDSLFDNSRKSNAVKAEGGRALKSLSDVLKGKQGRFRQNLLGKRVDYSGRSVIVVGPTLKLHECGIPKGMAAELFKPFIIRKLIERGIVKTVKSAKKLVDRKDPIIWDILENVLKGHPVMLNRAPTLHRLSIQAFQPTLIEGKAIQLHPLVCSAFNADFDGDQMAVHVPLGNQAILEAQILMLSAHNMLNPQNGTPITLPSQDMVLGLYYLTKERRTLDDVVVKGEGRNFYSSEEVIIAYNEGNIDLHALINVRARTLDEEGNFVYDKRIETTVGRVIFNEKVPETVPFVNQVLSKRNLKKVISSILKLTNTSTTATFLDDIKDMGFYWAYRGGLSFNLPDLITPSIRKKRLEMAHEGIDDIWNNYNMGLITNNERYNQIIDEWTQADNEITNVLMDEMASHKQGFNSVYMMLDSGARGSKQQIKQLCGLRGLMAKPRKSGDTGGAIIENPVLANFVQGLSVLDYFISTHGARKGLADTALKTADAGYLTRRLVDVSQDVVINLDSCDTLRGITRTAKIENDKEIESLADRIEGRYLLNDIVDPETGDVIVSTEEVISSETAQMIQDMKMESVKVRSVLTCEAKRGVCLKCYGKNLATGRLAERGDAVGIIAAQSIGEPGTQLTLRTFHVGGTASYTVEESSFVSKYDGRLEFDGVKTVMYKDEEKGIEYPIVISRSGEIRVIDTNTNRVLNTNNIKYGSSLFVKDGEMINKGDKVCEWDAYNSSIISEFDGVIEFENIIEGKTYRVERDDLTGHEQFVVIESKNKKQVPAIKVVDKEGEVLRSYNVPVGSFIDVVDEQKVVKGLSIVKIPRVMGKIQDITGGLPRVTELFEARKPSTPAVVSEIDGIISFGRIKRGNRECIVTARDGQKRKYLIGLSRHILVQEGDFVKAGLPLSNGNVVPHDILSIEGPFSVQKYLVNGVQEVYLAQGITINDKHIEVIVRQMMRKVQILDAGDTKFLEKEAVSKEDFREENEYIFDKLLVTDAGGSSKVQAGMLISERQFQEEKTYLKRNERKSLSARQAIPATAKPLLQGITKSSLGTKSWISAASFQETTKVLSTASISAAADYLVGLKENVIVGKKIPAGTGMRHYDSIIVADMEKMEAIKAKRLAEEAAEVEEEQVVIGE